MPAIVTQYENHRGPGPSIVANQNDIHEQRRQEIAQRIQIRDKIRGASLATQTEGVMGKFRQMNNYNPEAVSGEMMADLFVLLVQFCSNAPYSKDKMIFNELLQEELKALLNGQVLRLVFEPDEHGNLPTLYPLGPDGKVQVEMPAITDPAQMTELVVRKNGYTPRPSFTRGLKMAMDLHIETTLGSGMLSELDRLRLHGTTENNGASMEGNEPDPNQTWRRPVMRPAAPA